MATNQQRREAAKRKLDRQLQQRAQQAARNRIIGIVAIIAAVVVVAGVVVFLATRGSEGEPAAAPETQDAAPEMQIPTERVEPAKRAKPLPNPESCDYMKSPEPASKKVTAPANGKVPSTGTVELTLSSSAGDIPVTLDRSLAPCTVNSFVHLAEAGFYDGSECHRLGTEGLQMLQCGDPTASGTGGPGYTIKDENFKELVYGRGILAMAKTQAPDSGGSQFFMVYGDAPLPPDYTVFGTISDEGLSVLDKVAKGGIAETGPDGTGKPSIPVKFTKATVNS